MDPGVYIVRCAWGACRRRCGGGGVAGEAFGVGGSLLCSRCSGGGSLQIRRPRRVRRFLEPRRAFPRAGVRDGGAGSCSWGSSAFTSVLGGAFAQDLWELQAGCSSSTAGSDGVVEEGWCWRWLRADGRSPFRCRRLRRLDLAAFQQGWSGRRLRCEVSSLSSSPVACCWRSKEVCGVVAPISPCGIEPFVTLHHFDQPQELEIRYGSWLGAGIREEFDYYADVCFRAFGDRVKFWTTFNEPNVFAKHSYMLGTYPPNHCSAPFGTCNSGNSNREPYVAAHNIIMSHAAVFDNYKRNYQAKQGGSIGIVIEMKFYEPLTNTTEDILAGQRAMSFEIHWFLDPLFFGEYPKEMREMLSSNLQTFSPAEKRLLQNKVDFIGVNHYTAIYAKDCIFSPCDLNTYEGNALVLATGERDGVRIGKPTAIVGFYDVPEGMEQIIEYVNKRYENTPVYVTENGYSQHSSNGLEDLINDVGRVNYLQGYLSSISSAVRRGANVCGYFVWSLMDNFEWAYGFTIRFGLYHVDFDTQVRTQKMSAKWYQGFLIGSRPVDALQTLRVGS